MLDKSVTKELIERSKRFLLILASLVQDVLFIIVWYVLQYLFNQAMDWTVAHFPLSGIDNWTGLTLKLFSSVVTFTSVLYFVIIDLLQLYKKLTEEVQEILSKEKANNHE